jgi:hypothetical protein
LKKEIVVPEAQARRSYAWLPVLIITLIVDAMAIGLLAQRFLETRVVATSDYWKKLPNLFRTPSPRRNVSLKSIPIIMSQGECVACEGGTARLIMPLT